MKLRIFAYNVITHVRYFLEKADRDNIAALAGQSAFFMILSFVPFLLFAFSSFTMLTGLDLKSVLTDQTVLSDLPGFSRILSFVEDSVNYSGSGTTVITAVIALWSAGKGMYCVSGGISRVYGLRGSSFWLVRRVYSMGYTLLMLLMLMLDIALISAGVFFSDTVSGLIGGGGPVRWTLIGLLYVVFMLIQALLMTLAMKTYLDDKLSEKSFYSVRALMPGMLLTVIVWNLLTFGVLIYIRRFAVSSIYGSLSTVFIAMTWIYLMMYILLAGIELNYIYRDVFASRKKNSKKKKSSEG